MQPSGTTGLNLMNESSPRIIGLGIVTEWRKQRFALVEFFELKSSLSAD